MQRTATEAAASASNNTYCLCTPFTYRYLLFHMCLLKRLFFIFIVIHIGGRCAQHGLLIRPSRMQD